MNAEKVGGLLRSLRLERGMTQKQLGDALHVSDKAVSKWERALGCPDVSLLGALSQVFQVNLEKLLEGELSLNEQNGGNVKKIKFYRCPDCGTILTATGDAEVSCCGRKLAPLQPKISDDAHRLKVEIVEDEAYITFSHEMTKSHYLTFVACVTDCQMLFTRLYPEQGGELRIPQLRGSTLYFGCSKHGLWVNA